MNIRILFFARLREAFDRAQEDLQVPDGVAVADVLLLLAARGENWSRELQGGRIVRAALNEEMVPMTAMLKDGDVLALFPPVTGG